MIGLPVDFGEQVDPAYQRAVLADLDTWVNVLVNVIPWVGDTVTLARLSVTDHLREVSVTCA